MDPPAPAVRLDSEDPPLLLQPFDGELIEAFRNDGQPRADLLRRPAQGEPGREKVDRSTELVRRMPERRQNEVLDEVRPAAARKRLVRGSGEQDQGASERSLDLKPADRDTIHVVSSGQEAIGTVRLHTAV